MSNFAFLREQWPELYDDCANAEAYMTTDPRAAAIYARRSIEHLMKYFYHALKLSVPYPDTLDGRIRADSFATIAQPTLIQKLTVVRKMGNRAVHGSRPIADRDALRVLTELHHVMLWTAFRFAHDPGSVPITEEFSRAKAAARAALSTSEVQSPLAKFEEQDRSHAGELAERDAEIARLQAIVDAGLPAEDPRDYREAETRAELIDPILAEAGWHLRERESREYPVTGMPNATGKGAVDYVLWGDDGRPLALVEAKRTSVSPQAGERQAELYADRLEEKFDVRPLIFLSNGYEHWMWDDAGGYPKREVYGFLTKDELQRTIRRRDERKPLSTAAIDDKIAGRHYQTRAIRAIDPGIREWQARRAVGYGDGLGENADGGGPRETPNGRGLGAKRPVSG